MLKNNSLKRVAKFGIKAASPSEVSDERALAMLEFQKKLETSNFSTNLSVGEPSSCFFSIYLGT